jgi:phage baseplate assembly protein W
MALSPLQPAEERVEVVTPTPEPSLTYRLDIEKGEIGGLIDGDEALRQFVSKAIRTARYRYLIYDDEYGSELEDLIGSDVTEAFLNEEIPRIIREALIYDDRIADVRDFNIQREGDGVYIEFIVEKTDGGTLTEEVTL